MPDRILAASALDAGIAITAAITTELVGEIRDRHDLWPTATAAVGRLATGAALLAANLKGNERISLQIAGNGPLGNIAADAWFLDERYDRRTRLCAQRAGRASHRCSAASSTSRAQSGRVPFK